MSAKSYEAREGYTQIIGPGELRFIEFGMLRLSQGARFAQAPAPKERALILLSGKCALRCPEHAWRGVGERTSVFGGRACALYLPPNMACEIEAEETVEIAVASTPADISAEPVLVTPSEVTVSSRGTSLWRREIHDIITPRIKAQRLVVGETFNPPGKWSSYPPHKHVEDLWPVETVQEELYFFRLQPEGGFGLQRLYTADGSQDEALVIRDNTIVTIPRGYHPVVVAPGYKLYYLWILAGERRELRPHDDPAHAWVHSAAAMLDEEKR